MLVQQEFSLAQLLGKEAKHSSSSSDDLFSTTINTPPRLHKFYWRRGEKVGVELPSAVIPFNGDVESFYADVATYYPNISPISAYMHVLDDEFFSLSKLPVLENIKKATRYSGLGRAKHRIWVALALVEAASMAFNNGAGTDVGVTYSICRRSLSFTLARADILYPHYPRNNVVDKWLQLREISRMNFSPEICASIMWIASIAFDSSSPALDSQGQPSDLAEMIRRMIDRTPSHSQFTKYLSEIYPSISGHLHILTGNYDGRMQGLSQIINDVRVRSRGAELDAMTIAFFCNNILPGSLAHIKLLTKLIGEYPSILIWYGFFSGLSEDFDWRGAISGIGQKLSRDLYLPFNLEVHQSADIALEELAVLSRIKITVGAIKPIQQRTMLVSLLPGIDILCRMPTEDGVESHSEIRATHNEERNRQIDARDKQLQRLLSEAQALLKKSDGYGAASQNSRSSKKPPRKTAKSNKPNDRH